MSERTSAADREEQLDEAVASFLQAAEAGLAPDPQEWLTRYPDVADELQRFVAGNAQFSRLAAPLRLLAPGVPEGTVAGLGRLGDFQLLREVGRGGMGVVYEAEQISLGRRVALKVLPFAATMDPRQLQRFHNEARAAASLHHEHVVPVFAVGCERGVHYYAMQFIDGRTLAEVVAAVGSDAPRDAAHFRRVAEWGVQAAEALDHAHSVGIVHRDVKPGNLMLDAHGKLWVTDFGLARTAEGNLTMSGDVVGTLRYASPEQALARHGLVDHRTDVYGLGVTLYELLTGRPAFDGIDRQQLLLQIAGDEPPAPRTLDRAIPVDLETIVRKATTREPAERYASARDLADDLRRFLERRPILARRPGLMDRASKWAGRHRGAVAAAALALTTFAVASAVGAALLLAAYQREAAARQAAINQQRLAEQNERAAETRRQQAEENLDEAIVAWRASLETLAERRPRVKGAVRPEVVALHQEQAQRARSFLQRQATRLDGDPTRQFEAALIHAALATTARALDDFDAQEKELTRAVEFHLEAVAASPENYHYRKSLDALYCDVALAAHSAHLRAAEDNREKDARWTETLRAVRLYALTPIDWVPPSDAPLTVRSALWVEQLELHKAADRLRQLGRSEDANRLLERRARLMTRHPPRWKF